MGLRAAVDVVNNLIPNNPETADAAVLQLCEDREEMRKRSSLLCKDEAVRCVEQPVSLSLILPTVSLQSSTTSHVSVCSQGVLSDSENEEPISRRIRHVSAFVRKTRNSSSLTG